MAEHCARTAGHDCGEVPPAHRERGKPDREDAAPVERMQRSGAETTSDTETVQPDPRELSPGDRTMLPAGEPRDGLAPLTWHGIVADFATYPCHLARVAGWVLRRGWLCYGTATPGARAGTLEAVIGPPAGP